MAELWDAYDNAFNKINGITLVRGEPLFDGIYHLVAEIIVKHTDGTYLLMQRDRKKHLGGMWELTAGGSALQGESASDCATRELGEETGISAIKMKEIGRLIHDTHHSLYVEYLCVTNCEKNSVRLQEGETVNYQWVKRSSLLEMSKDELASTRTVKLLRELGI